MRARYGLQSFQMNRAQCVLVLAMCVFAYYERLASFMAQDKRLRVKTQNIRTRSLCSLRLHLIQLSSGVT